MRRVGQSAEGSPAHFRQILGFRLVTQRLQKLQRIKSDFRLETVKYAFGKCMPVMTARASRVRSVAETRAG
jgi:hypothetical protein